MKTKTIIALLLTLSFLTACAQTPTQGGYPPPGSNVTPTSAAPSPTEVVPTPTKIPVDLTPAQKAAVEEVSTKYNIPIDQITVTSSVAVTWPTGCLGVVIPGYMCTDVVTPGFRITLSGNGQNFEMHTNEDGSSVIDAAQQLATLGFVVQLADQSIQVVSPNIPLGSTYNPAFNGFLPLGGANLGTAYVLDFSRFRALAVHENGQRELSFIVNPNYAMAIWRGAFGTPSLLAWGTQPSTDTQTSSLQVAELDGSNLQTLLTVDTNTAGPVQLVAEAWSADGKSLYFSKEPVGIGGYILYSGASNLYKIDLATKDVTELIAQAPSNGPQICLDAISGDYNLVADHCTEGVITIRDLQSGITTTIQPPAEASGFKVMGSARFSPASDRVAFALAKSDPNNEQSWVALAAARGGPSQLVLTGEPGTYYTVQGWLDDQTLLVQVNSITNPNAGSQLYTVKTDGTGLTKVADGSFLTIIDNR